MQTVRIEILLGEAQSASGRRWDKTWMRRLVEVKDMFSLNVMKFSHMYSYVKTYRLCTLNMCSLLHVSFTSEP